MVDMLVVVDGPSELARTLSKEFTDIVSNTSEEDSLCKLIQVIEYMIAVDIAVQFNINFVKF